MPQRNLSFSYSSFFTGFMLFVLPYQSHQNTRVGCSFHNDVSNNGLYMFISPTIQLTIWQWKLSYSNSLGHTVWDWSFSGVVSCRPWDGIIFWPVVTLPEWTTDRSTQNMSNWNSPSSVIWYHNYAHRCCRTHSKV